MTRVVGIGSSPVRGGITERMLDAALDGAACAGAECEKIIVDELTLKSCRSCGSCSGSECVIDDDMRPARDKISAADIIIVASPVYFGSVTAQLKTLIDRFNYAWVNRHIIKSSRSGGERRGIFLCASGLNRKVFFENSALIIKLFFLTIGVKYCGGVYFGGSEDAGPGRIKRMIERCFCAGKKLAETKKPDAKKI